MPGLPKGPFLENRVKSPDSIRGRKRVAFTNGCHFRILKIWAVFPFCEGGGRKARVGKKGPPKRNTVHQNALYAAQFLGILAIGARYESNLPSVGGFYDGDGEEGTYAMARGSVGDFLGNF